MGMFIWAASWQNQQSGIHPVWSESSLSAWRNLGALATHWAHSEDWSDSFCWFCHVAAHLSLQGLWEASFAFLQKARNSNFRDFDLCCWPLFRVSEQWITLRLAPTNCMPTGKRCMSSGFISTRGVREILKPGHGGNDKVRENVIIYITHQILNTKHK